MNNPNLSFFVIAGADDPVIRSREKFGALIGFLTSLGYGDVRSKLYDHMRHEILNETGKYDVYRDVVCFFDE